MGKKAGISAVVVAALVVGYGAADVFDVVPGVLTTSPEKPAYSAPEVPGLTQKAAGPVLADLPRHADEPTRPGLKRALSRLLKEKALGKNLGFEVRDAASGKILYSVDGDRGRTPASTTKLLTATAALTALGPDQRFSTSVLQGPGKGEITLRAGGDVMLGRGKSKPAATVGHAGLATLARKTAAALKKSGTSSVAVRLDTTLFSGPSTNRRWAQHSIQNGQVAPIEPLMVDTGEEKPGRIIPRSTDPAMSAATVFASKLAADGIDVIGKPTRMAAQSRSKVLASVKSATLSQIVRHMVQLSDNTVAETLGRLVAVQTGRPGSTLDAIDAVTDEVKNLNVDLRHVTLHDLSGLSHSNRITPTALSEILALAASGKHADLDSLIPSLPVGGLNGTLQYRYGGTGEAGAGLVHAKTGSLFRVSSLAGAVTDSSGRLLTFALIANKTPADNVEGTHEAIDAVAARLAECGCAG